MSSFQADLKFGEEFQLRFIDYLSLDEYDDIEFAPKYKFSDYDIKIKKGATEVKYEIKTDRKTKFTGNFCIEYECYNKPSGISTTKSDYYGYFVVNTKTDVELYIIPVMYIKLLIESGKFKRFSGGDNYMSKFYLIPKAEFAQFLTPQKITTTDKQ